MLNVDFFIERWKLNRAMCLLNFFRILELRRTLGLYSNWNLLQFPRPKKCPKCYVLPLVYFREIFKESRTSIQAALVGYGKGSIYRSWSKLSYRKNKVLTSVRWHGLC